MSDRKRLGRELLDHLEFQRELGVKRIDPRPAVKPASPTKKPAPVVEPPTPPVVHAPELDLFATTEAAPPPESLEAIRQDIGDCRRCKLAPTRTNLVFGSGNPQATLMFVGEAPGGDEDKQGLPFVGRAGQLLTKIIESMDIRREDVYICNILKCRPPENRNPEADEIASCEPFLFRQIAAVRPKVICALGTFGTQTLLRTKEPISRLRGRFYEYRGSRLMATFHPAYLLRNPMEKKRVWEDMQKIREYLDSLGPASP
jgi:uracil-DNA glycosylase